MVKCPDCKKEMLGDSSGCTYPLVTIRGRSYKRDTTQYDMNRFCHDCNIHNARGNLHHFGCDVERCPRCGGQLISCDCGHKTPTRTRKERYTTEVGLPERFLR